MGLDQTRLVSTCESAPNISDGVPLRSKALAFLAVFTIAVSTVSASQLTRHAQTGLNAPFFVMYAHIAMMSICWPIAKAHGNGIRVTASFRDVVCFLPLWVASNYCFVAALAYAPAGLVQTLFGTAPAIVAVLSRFLLLEPLTALRVVAVMFAFLGTAAVASGSWSMSQDKRTGVEILLGGAWTLGAVASAACYKVFFKLRLGEPSVSVVLGFVGTFGVVAAVVGLPISLLISVMGAEDRWWDGSAPVSWGLVLASASVDVVYNVSVACGLALASPTFIAVGVIIGSPVNLLIDAVVQHKPPGFAEIIGAIFIASSFGMLSFGLPRAGMRTTRSWT